MKKNVSGGGVTSRRLELEAVHDAPFDRRINPTPQTVAHVVFVLMASSVTLAFAQEIPIRLTWEGDPRTEVAVSWNRNAPGRGKVEYGLTTNYTHCTVDGGDYYRHAIRIGDLLPGTTYHYRASSSDGFQTADRTFRTAAESGGSLQVVVHGDLQGGNDPAWSRTVVESIMTEPPDLVIHVGDLSNETDTPGFSTWANFFILTTNELERVVFMPIKGNHDAPALGSSYFDQVFALPPRPADGDHYSFAAAGAHFVGLNSDVGVPGQTNWLSRDLQGAMNDTNVNWIIPFFHRPPYSWGERGGEDHVKTNWCRLFTMYQADMVFSGHSHNYQRSIPIRDVTYVVTGGGGGTLYTSAVGESAHAYATTCYHHVSMSITGRVMHYRAIRSDGLVFENQVFVNPPRKVRFDPAFPLRGENVKIVYDAALGPLAGRNPIYVHRGVDDWAEVTDVALSSNPATGFWETEFVVPTSAVHRLVCAFYEGSDWDNGFEYNWQALLGRMEFIPAIPTAGAPAILRYDAAIGPLAASPQVSAVIGYENWRYTEPSSVAFTNNPAVGRWEATILLPDYVTRLDVVVTDGVQWDNHDGLDWHVEVAGATGHPPAFPFPILVEGSPALATNPPVVENNPGDNFDFNREGTALRAQNTGTGFGDFGGIYFNYDSSNFYVGGIDANLGGSNNVFILFLGFDTLTNSAFNLWHKSGPPNALDYLHNVAFSDPMDIAIVYGDEHGDLAAYTNFTYGGYDFGQGIFEVGTDTSSFRSVLGARLSQFDGTNSVPVVTHDDDGNRRTERWEAGIPWSSLNASNGIASMSNLLVAGVIGSDSVTDQDRYLSATFIGRQAYASRDGYNQFAKNFVVLIPSKVLHPYGDESGEGLPNLWKQLNFGGVEGWPGPNDDPDGDAFPNRSEWKAGTDPTNVASFLGLQEASPSVGNGMVVSWPGVSNRTYAVLQTASLMGGLTNIVASNLSAVAPLNVHTVSADSAAGFLAVGVEE